MCSAAAEGGHGGCGLLTWAPAVLRQGPGQGELMRPRVFVASSDVTDEEGWIFLGPVTIMEENESVSALERGIPISAES